MLLPQLIKKLNEEQDSPLFIIDVGCHKGHFRDELFSQVKSPMFILGVDPLDFNVTSKYNLYIQVAIANVDTPIVKEFYEYCESGCSSLMKMNTDVITHKESETNKWFVPWEIEELIFVHPVLVDSLAHILDSGREDIKRVHLLKVDAQGMDIEVVKSLKHYLPKTNLIQIESVTTHDPNIVLYEGQSILEKDIEDMQQLGFNVLGINYPNYVFKTNEADVVFINTSYENL